MKTISSCISVWVLSLIFPVLGSRYDFQCPQFSQWSIRAKTYNCSTLDGYVCVYDQNSETYIEICRDKPLFDSEGYQFVYSGGLTGIPCSENAYQPYIIWTNRGSSCVFKMSSCKGEGQTVINNGTAISDRQCGCDYSKGYAFVTKPKHKCFCVPSEEDCSCYLRSCPVGSVLTPDYDCDLISNWKSTYGCPLLIQNEQMNIIPRFVRIPKDGNHIDKEKNLPLIILVLVSTVSIIVIAWIILCHGLCKTTNQKKDLTLSQVVYNEISMPYVAEKQLKPSQVICNKISKPNYAHVPEYEKDRWKKKLKYFVETGAFKEILKTIKDEQCVMITGPPGSGKSATAFYVASVLEKMDDYDVLVVVDPQDVVKCATTHKKQIFVLDDAFGTYSVNDNIILWWNRQGTVVKSLLQRNTNMKLVITCRSHIYSSFGLDQIRITVTVCSLLSLRLAAKERRKIAMSYISDDNMTTLSEDILMMFDFFPALCATFKFNDGELLVEYFTTPLQYLRNELDNFHKYSEVNFFSLLLLVVKNNKITRDWFQEDNNQDMKMLNEMASELECLITPSKNKILSCLTALIGTYVKEGESGLTFLNNEIFEVFALATSKYIIKFLLKYGDSSFLKSRIIFESHCAPHSKQQIILPKYLEKVYLGRLVQDLNEGRIWDVFTDMINSLSEFRKSFIGYIQKHLKIQNLKDRKDDSTALHVVSHEGYEDYLSYLISLDKSRVNQKNASGKLPLHYACANGQAKIISLLVKNHSCIDIADNTDQTPLEIACERSHVEAALILLSNKAKIRQRPSDLNTALHISCKTGNVKMTELLLAYNANVNTPNKHGETPLLIACQTNNTSLAKVLLEKKVNPNIDDVDGKSSLHFACEFGNIDLVGLLIAKGANMNKKDGEGNTPLHFASFNSNIKLTELLLSHGSNINLCNKDGKTPLSIACIRNDTVLVKTLIKYKADINKCDIYNKSPFYCACEHKLKEVARLLISERADVNISDKKNNSPLHIVSHNGQTDLLDLISPFIKNVNQQNKEGYTPIHLACENGHDEVVVKLIKLGADITKKDSNNLLIKACKNGHKNIAEILINNNASVNQANTDGTTPLIACCEKGFDQLATLLLSRNADVNQTEISGKTPLYVACKEGHNATVKAILKLSSDVNVTEKDDFVHLNLVDQSENTDNVADLLTLNVDINMSENTGLTPLHAACLNQNTEIIELLLKSKASVNQQDKSGQTPLFKAASIGHLPTVQLLINNGASVNILDKNKMSPLLVALQKGHFNVSDLLKMKGKT